MASLQRYTDRRVFITGGGSGIGQATVLRILDEGGRVVAADISEAGPEGHHLQSRAARRPAHHGCDGRRQRAIREGPVWPRRVERLGGLDTLVNVAGILRAAHCVDTTLADFEQVLRINLIGTFLVTREGDSRTARGKRPAVGQLQRHLRRLRAPLHGGVCRLQGRSPSDDPTRSPSSSSRKASGSTRWQPGSISSGMTDGTGESKQSIGPGLPADADFSLFTKVTPMLAARGRSDVRQTGRGGPAVVATLGSTRRLFRHRTEVRIDGGTHM